LALRNWRFASPKTIKRLLVTEVEDLRVTSISRCVRFHVKRSSSPCAPTAQDTKQFAHCSGIKLQFQLQTKSAWRKSIILYLHTPILLTNCKPYPNVLMSPCTSNGSLDPRLLSEVHRIQALLFNNIQFFCKSILTVNDHKLLNPWQH
jgi:hypothetical protein